MAVERVLKQKKKKTNKCRKSKILVLVFLGHQYLLLNHCQNYTKNQVNIKFVVSQTPKPSGRGKRISDSPVGDFAKKKKTFICYVQIN